MEVATVLVVSPALAASSSNVEAFDNMVDEKLVLTSSTMRG